MHYRYSKIIRHNHNHHNDYQTRQKYKLLYSKLIEYRINNKPILQEDTISQLHKHHVIPQCINPLNNKIVYLTDKEHCVAHYFLWMMTDMNKSNKSFLFGLNMYSAYKGLSVAFGVGPKKQIMKNYINNLISKLKTDISSLTPENNLV